MQHASLSGIFLDQGSIPSRDQRHQRLTPGRSLNCKVDSFTTEQPGKSECNFKSLNCLDFPLHLPLSRDITTNIKKGSQSRQALETQTRDFCNEITELIKRSTLCRNTEKPEAVGRFRKVNKSLVV